MKNGCYDCVPAALLDKFIEGGFIYNSKDHESQKYAEIKKDADNIYNSVLRAHLVMSYDCNLACVYCFEKGIKRTSQIINPGMLHNCLTTIKSLVNERPALRRVEIVLFGGEPLINMPLYSNRIKEVLDYAKAEGWTVDIITNGVDLHHYVDLLKEYDNIGQIQITIDGLKETHDKRKPCISSDSSFEAITKSIDIAVKAGLSCSIRINIDSQNISQLPELAAYFSSKGWFGYKNFGPYIGMTYDFYGDYEHQLSPDIVLDNILKMRLSHPDVRKLKIESWEPVQFLIYPYFYSAPRVPKFNYCSAQRNEFNFDLNGNLFFCADSVGRDDCIAGKYYPNLEIYNIGNKIRNNKVDGLDTPCSSCKTRLCCGGGCWFRRYLSNAKCTEVIYRTMEVALKHLHRHPEVFQINKNRLTHSI